MKLNLESLVVESFATDAAPITSRPRTFEPGCTMPELCGTGVAD